MAGLVFLGGCWLFIRYSLGGWFYDHRFFGKALTESPLETEEISYVK